MGAEWQPGILERLKRVRRNGDGWIALCPAHKDRNPSLSIHVRDGRILLHCHAGCSPEAISAALGIELLELSLDGRSAPRIVAEYSYTDEKGQLLFQVVRYEPKDFRQRRPDGTGGWVWNTKGVRRVPYHLPEVMKAELVFVVEGEKDAETLHCLGLVASTNSGGAGKWSREFSKYFKGRDVVIFPDNDEPGRKHAEEVARNLLPVARSIKIIPLPGLEEHGDISDWCAKVGGRAKEALCTLVQDTQAWTPSATAKEAGPKGGQLHEKIRSVVVDAEKLAFDKRRLVAKLIREDLLRRGLSLRTTDGRAFFFDNERHRLYEVDGTEFEHTLTCLSGLSASEIYFKFALDVLQAKAFTSAPLSEVQAFSYFDAKTGFQAVSDGGAGMWIRERSASWRYAHNGSNGIVFFTEPDAIAWTPDFQADDRALDWFLSNFLFAPEPLSVEDARTALLIFLLHQFFPSLRRTRVIPTFLGAQGSGKSSGLRFLGRLLLGPNFEVTSLHRDREDGYIAAVTNRMLLALDNVDSKIPWIADALAVYATGQRYRLRQLYKTNEEASFSPRAILLLSSRDPRFRRPDVAERLLPLYFDRPAHYRTEDELFSQLDHRRSAIMGAILNLVAQIADQLPEYPPQPVSFRMADFAVFGHRVFAARGQANEWQKLLSRLESMQIRFASEDDGIIAALEELLRRQGELLNVSISDLFHACSGVAQDLGLAFPRTAQGFGQALTSRRRVIELELGVKFSESRRHGRTRVISLTPLATRPEAAPVGDEEGA